MRKALKITGYILLIVILLVVGLLTYIKIALPNVGAAPDLTVDRSPEHVERGRYLANTVTVCMDCHSTRDWAKFAGPLTAGTLGEGGDRFDQKLGFPGVFYSRNITPAGISRYTDGELFRVITTGVNKEGKAMFPVMPYHYYGQMDPDDIKCIIAYIRTLSPIDKEVPVSVPDFPMNFILNTIPHKADPHKAPPVSDQLAYGAYLINASVCVACHTPVKRGQLIAGKEYTGGRDFTFPDGSVVRSANITPDKTTGIGNWTEQQFIRRFKMYTDSGYVLPTVNQGSFNTIMPWNMYSRMKQEDLAAIFAYLKQLKPVANTVEKYTAASVASR
jgi:mono/diheme cytochrome c family protein